jgi:hypothetical protein
LSCIDLLAEFGDAGADYLVLPRIRGQQLERTAERRDLAA